MDTSFAGRRSTALGDVSAYDASWSPDGKQIAYVIRNSTSEVRAVNSDGTGVRKLFSQNGALLYPAFSSDGRKLRVSAVNSQSDASAIWQMNADGSDAHVVVPEDWNKISLNFQGRWTADEKYFVFAASQAGSSGFWDLWALPECRSSLFRCKTQPVQLTNGPLQYSSPLPGKDGKQLFAVGIQQRAELVRYDARSGQYFPFLSGISAAHVAFSDDGQWVAWVNYPENTLWCSKVDGSERRQLTFSPMLVLQPRWSHDGTRIAFTARECPASHGESILFRKMVAFLSPCSRSSAAS